MGKNKKEKQEWILRALEMENQSRNENASS